MQNQKSIQKAKEMVSFFVGTELIKYIPKLRVIFSFFHMEKYYNYFLSQLFQFQLCNHEFFRTEEVSRNNGTSINISPTT